MSYADFVLLDTLVIVSLTALTFLFFHFFRTVETSKQADEKLPFISVLIPVRNEEEKIKRCLDSLIAQDYPRFEIIVVDDRSTDASARIITEVAAQSPMVKAVFCPPGRPGWLGKCNALDYASKYASGSWYAFIDADTYHHPNSLRDAVSAAMTYQVDLISFMPVQELYTFCERAVMPVLLGSFLCGDPLNKINDDTDPRAYAYGQYTLVKGDTYKAIGGHESVKNQILDDIAIARVVKGRGYRITTADGRRLYAVRMYTGFLELWQGWTKNVYALLDCNPIYLIGLLVLLNMALLVPFVSLTGLLNTLIQGNQDPSLPLLSALLVIQFGSILSWYYRTTLHYRGVKMWHVILLPVGTLMVTVLHLYSAFCFIGRLQVTWKGRKYSVSTAKTIAPDINSIDRAHEY
jgi:chlorobactene glucosyltransferase